MNALTDLYQEVILDHSRHPRNFGQAADANHESKGYNPLCGDRISVYLRIENGVIANASFEAKGCAISVASASMMTDMIKGMTEEQATHLFGRFHALMTGNGHNDDNDDSDGGDGLEELEDLAALSGVRAFPSRIKCATLAWHAMKAAMAGNSEEVRTE